MLLQPSEEVVHAGAAYRHFEGYRWVRDYAEAASGLLDYAGDGFHRYDAASRDSEEFCRVEFFAYYVKR